jgi:GNAT superfamily N-acetyltransferase
MITTQNHKLIDLKAMFSNMADIGFEAVGKSREATLEQLAYFAPRGMGCVTVYDAGELIGYTLYGPVRLFLDPLKNVRTFLRLREEGIRDTYTACHVHLRKAYWKTGTQKQMSQAMARAILDEGASYLLLSDYATDQLAAYSLKQPGSRALDGVLDSNGWQVGVRNLAAYLAATAPEAT